VPLDFIDTSSLTEDTSIALANNIQIASITFPIDNRGTNRTLQIDTTYVRLGDDRVPILLLHGFDSSLFEFRRLLPLLAKERETWALDLLGFGFTARPDTISFNPDAIKTHLYSFWQQSIGRPVILVGASMGGATAIDFTLSYPEAVSQLILLDSAGLANPPTLGKFMFPPLDKFATAFLSNPKVRQNISRTAYYDKTFASEDARSCAALHLSMPNWDRALISFTKSGGYGSFASRLPEIERSTLILWGKDDRILGTKAAIEFAKIIPNSKLVWIARCGHVPHLEMAELTAKEILGFSD
jgi:pimeloyl-ACP methyl ester carboxylesterase